MRNVNKLGKRKVKVNCNLSPTEREMLRAYGEAENISIADMIISTIREKRRDIYEKNVKEYTETVQALIRSQKELITPCIWCGQDSTFGGEDGYGQPLCNNCLDMYYDEIMER